MTKQGPWEDLTVVAWSPPPRPGERDKPPGSAEPPPRRDPNAKTFGPDGRYEVVSRIGKGGFGTVYRAYDHRLARYVALKTINISEIAPSEIDDYVRQFDREAKMAAQLEHPGVVSVLDYDPYGEEPYLVMPLVESGTLQDWLGKHPRIPWPDVADLGIQVADALHYAHTHGIEAHRDVKPANIFCAGGWYKVGDFGIARRFHRSWAATASTFLSAGTPRYMAPEQIVSPRSVDARSDLFSLCVILYEALTGKNPFPAVSVDPEQDPESAQRIIDAAFGSFKPIRKLAPETSLELARVIEKGLSKDPNARYRNCAELAAALRSVLLQGRKAEKQKRLLKRVALVTAAVLLIAFAARFGTDAVRRSARFGTTVTELTSQVSESAREAWSALTTDTADLVVAAHSEARAAQADQYAKAIWDRAEDARAAADVLVQTGKRGQAEKFYAQALDLYARAAQEAWSARLAAMRQEIASARERFFALDAERSGAAQRWYQRGEEEQQNGEALQRDKPKQADVHLRAALGNYRKAVEKAEEVTLTAWRNRLDTLTRDRERLAPISAAPSAVVEASRAFDALLDEARSEVDAGAPAKRVAPLLEKAEAGLHDLALEHAFELRRRVEELRTMSAAAGALSGDAERMRARAEEAYKRGSTRMGQGRTREDLFAAIELFQQAQPDLEELTVRNAESALAEAVAARARAEDASASLFAKASAKVEQGERLLADARRLLQPDPRGSARAARRASNLFSEAQQLARSEGETLLADLPMKRALALRAQQEADAARARLRRGAADAYDKGEAALHEADERTGVDTGSLLKRLASYEEAIRRFNQAERLARPGSPPEEDSAVAPEEETASEELTIIESASTRPNASEPVKPVAPKPPPFEVKQNPPPGQVVLVYSGVTTQFTVRAGANGARYRWSFAGKPIDHVDTPAMDMRLTNYPPGEYEVEVTVSDRNGGNVTKRWTVRVLPPNISP